MMRRLLITVLLLAASTLLSAGGRMPDGWFTDEMSYYILFDDSLSFYSIGGVQVDGDCAGNHVLARFAWVSPEYEGARCEIEVRTGDGHRAHTDFITSIPGPFPISCADLDGDGTDEVIAFSLFRGSTGLQGDFHVFQYDEETLYEVGTVITDVGERTTEEMRLRYAGQSIGGMTENSGCELLPTKDGPMVRMFLCRHLYDTRYQDYYYRDGQWIAVRPVVVQDDYENLRAVLEENNLYEFSEDPHRIEYDACEDNIGTLVNLDGDHIADDMLYVHEMITSEDGDGVIILEVEQNLGWQAERRYLHHIFYGGERLSKFWVETRDVNGDGSQDILLAAESRSGSRYCAVLIQLPDESFEQVPFEGDAFLALFTPKSW